MTGPQPDVDWDAWIERRRDLFERRATFNRHAGLLLESAGPGWARMRLDLRPDVMNPFGAVHGGAIAALIDSAAGTAIAASMAAEGDRIRGTIDMQVHFLERGRGDALIAEGRVVRTGTAIAVAQVDVRDRDGALVAMGTATFRLGAPETRRNED
jgi:acyl-CoA thioesterase